MKAGASHSGFAKAHTTGDLEYMRQCLAIAGWAASANEVPVGALVVRDDKIIAAAYNLRETLQSPSAHAEMLAIEQAAKEIGSWRLTGCTLYVTLEPCPMCAGAIINARVPRVVYGAADPKAGAMGTMYTLHEGRLNHQPEVVSGVMGEECGDVLRRYFTEKRRIQKEEKEREKLGS